MVARETAPAGEAPGEFIDSVRGSLRELEQAGLLRRPLTVHGTHGPELLIDGRRVLCLCSNDYLGLAAHPAILAAIRGAAASHGAGASRHITGTNSVHRQAEAALAAFVSRPAALLFSSGYAANIGAMQATVGAGDVVFSDALNHASLIDGCRLSRAEVVVYPHLDASALSSLLAQRRRGHRTALVVSESIFSMDGDIAPLAALRALADEHRAGLMVDEAHALGVLGPSGQGLCAAAGVVPDIIVGTLGKAFGCSGAFVAGGSETVELIENRARSFVFSTATSPAWAAGVLAALELVRRADGERARVLGHAARLRDALHELGYRVPASVSHIIPAHVGSASAVMRLSAELLDRGVFVHGIRPPTVATGTSRLRITPMASHTEPQIEQCISFFPLITAYR